jgi:hypothetical protein
MSKPSFAPNNSLDVEEVVLGLLLFDTYIVESSWLAEIDTLVSVFGTAGLEELFDQKALEFNVYRIFAGHYEREAEDQSPTFGLEYVPGDSRKLNRFSITNVTIGNPEDVFHRSLQRVMSVPDLPIKKKIALKGKIAEQFVRPPNSYGTLSTVQTHLELDRDIAGFSRSVSHLLSIRFGREVAPKEVNLQVLRIDEIDVDINSNLVSHFGLEEMEAHCLLGNSLLAVDRLNVRIEVMRACQAVSGSRLAEFNFVDAKFDRLLGFSAPDPFNEFQRVVRVAQLPSFTYVDGSHGFDAKQFLQVRKSDECVEFRAWLRQAEEYSDDELHQRIVSIRTRLGNFSQSKAGKLFRLALTTGASLVPGVGPIAGIGASVLDSFLVDDVLKESGPIAFLTDQYPSFFAKDDN